MTDPRYDMIDSSEDLAIRPVTIDDAAELHRCFERCYEGAYAHEVYSDLASIRDHIEQGMLHSAVAVAADGEIVAHLGLLVRRPGDITVDGGGTLVDPRYRGRGLIKRLAPAVLEMLDGLDAIGYHHYPVTTHDIIQRLGADTGDVELGVMLAYTPPNAADTAPDEQTGDGEGIRSAALVLYHAYAEGSERSICCPAQYQREVETVLRAARLPRSLRPDDGPPTSTRSRIEIVVERKRRLCRLDVMRVASDFREKLAGALAAPEVTGADIVHLDIPLGFPGVDVATAAARKQGFFFCSVLPEFREGDVVRLQRIDPDVEEQDTIVLHTDRSRSLLEIVESDRREVARG